METPSASDLLRVEAWSPEIDGDGVYYCRGLRRTAKGFIVTVDEFLRVSPMMLGRELVYYAEYFGRSHRYRIQDFDALWLKVTIGRGGLSDAIGAANYSFGPGTSQTAGDS